MANPVVPALLPAEFLVETAALSARIFEELSREADAEFQSAWEALLDEERAQMEAEFDPEAEELADLYADDDPQEEIFGS